MIPIADASARTTEDAARRFQGLDTWRTGEILEALWASQSRAVAACLAALPALGRAIDAAIERLGATPAGRLVYAGAGSSGMIAALDAVELGPTFGWPQVRTAIFVAGGFELPLGPDQAAEDDAAGGAARARDARLGPSDVVVGISASGSSPYTVAVVSEARARGALTVAIGSRADSPLARAADHAVVTDTGPEVIAGSTRLGAGTAQKVVLNLLSTAVMVGMGLVFDNLMIEMAPANAKLRQRQIAIVASIAGVDPASAADALARHGEVKRAVLALAGVPDGEIAPALAGAGGNLRAALARARSGRSAP